jgi:glycosyltransferase involved in cell wall biosynthesis
MAEMPEDLRSRVKLVMCGRGENQALVESYAARIPQIVYNGWADAPQIRALMEISHFGLLPYPPDFDFKMSLPNKVSEYLSGGLPIVTSLPGETEKLFAEYSCGVLYRSGEPKTFQAVIQSFVTDPARLAALTQGAKAAGAARDATVNTSSFEDYLTGIAKTRR